MILPDYDRIEVVNGRYVIEDLELQLSYVERGESHYGTVP